MKQIKLNNLIFPVWILLFYPPVVFFTLAGNFIIDSLVVLACFFVFKLSKFEFNLKKFYKKNIIKVWGFGFLADIIGASLLFSVNILQDPLKISNAFLNVINYDPYKSPLALLIIIVAILLTSFFIFLFNYKVTFNEIEEKKLRFKLAITVAIVTMPFTFLIPTKWFY